MFGPPETRELEVWAQVPPSLSVSSRTSTWSRIHKGIATPASFLEGPVLDGAGGVYVVDVAWGRILRMTPDDVSVVVEYDGEPNGLANYAADQLAVADYRHGLMMVEGLGGTSPSVRPLLTSRAGERFRGVNDLILAEDGDLLFTDQGLTGLHDPRGRVYCLRPEGRLEVLLDGIPSPNGLVLDEPMKTLFVAVTRDNAVWRVPLSESGPHKVGRFLQLSGGVGPDGLALGPDGSLLVAHLGLGVVWVFDRLGVPQLVLRSPAGLSTTNLCVDQNGHVFVTESDTGSLLTADLSDYFNR